MNKILILACSKKNEWNFDKKKILSFFCLFKVHTLKKIIFTVASLQVNFLTATQFKLIPIQIQIRSYIKLIIIVLCCIKFW